MIKRARGKTKYMYFSVTESCPMAAGCLVRFLSGKVAPAMGVGSGGSESTPPTQMIGILRHTIASTDSDYATARTVEVEVPVENNVEWEVDFPDAGLVAADVGLYVDIYDASNMTRSASLRDQALVTKRISATKGYVVLNLGTYGFGSVGAA